MFDSRSADAGNVLRVDVQAIRVDVEDDDALFAAYMPFVNNGGIFVHADQLADADYGLGSEILLLLQLKAQDERLKVRGQIVWKSPGANSRYARGVGVQFRDRGETQDRLEHVLAGRLNADRPTDTP